MHRMSATTPPVCEPYISDWPKAMKNGLAGIPANSGSEISGQFLDFRPISLEETNRLAQMLSRIDNKYVVSFDQFRSFLGTIKKDYAVLEIDGRRQFSYDSCYYDDAFACYYDHHQGRRRRFKVRTREYVDTGGVYFEVKLKGLRGLTDKHRTGCDRLVSPRIEGAYLEMLNNVHRKNYRRDMLYDLRPALMVGYKRCTLVALKGGERVTIDYSLSFSKPGPDGPDIRIGNNFIIIETKSGDGKGIADTVLRSQKIRKASKCSKYCIGVNLTGSVTKNNYFLPTIKHIRQNIIAGSDLTNMANRASGGGMRRSERTRK